MTGPLSARDVIAEKASVIGSVPHRGQDVVCPTCFGPVVGFYQCYGCNRLFDTAPSGLDEQVVPMSIAINPGLWYRSMVNYKHGNNQDHAVVSALIAAFLAQHQSRISAMLGGSLTHIVVVPSTRGRQFAFHPLAKAVKRSRLFGDRLVDALAHVPGSTIARQEYKPVIFAVDASMVHGGRVVLIEDLWVSGGKAVLPVPSFQLEQRPSPYCQ